MLALWKSDIIPAILLFKSKKGGMMWVTFELGCKPSVEDLVKCHKLTY